MESEYPDHVEAVAWSVDTLVSSSGVLTTFRAMLDQFRTNCETDGDDSRWGSDEPGRLDLADRYTLLAAIHDAVCGDQSEKIMPSDWWQGSDQKPKCAIRYVALGRAGAPHFKGEAQLKAFLDQVTADLERRGESGPGSPKGLSKEALALAVLVDHPDWTHKRIAEAAGCHEKSLNRMKKFMAAKAALEQGQSGIPRGSKAKDGTIEAWDERDGDG